MRIVVIGASGLIGSTLVTKLDERGHETIAASPSTGVDTLTGEGLSAAVAGAAVVVDVSDFAEPDLFDTATRNLLAAEAAAGVGHHVALSVVGAERGRFHAKLAQEQLVESSSIPYSIVRATQLFELLDRIAADATDGNTVRLPPALIQPVTSDDVASALGRIAVGSPLNGIVEIAGSDRFRLDELIRARLTAIGDPRKVITDPEAPCFGIKLGERTLLPGDSHS